MLKIVDIAADYPILRGNRPCRGGLANLKHTHDMQEAGLKVGQRFNRRQVLKIVKRSRITFALCRCDCGLESFISKSLLLRGRSTVCARCRIKIDQPSSKHRETVGGKPTHEYVAWCQMKRRCYSKRCDKYPIYGGRGIKVCERWEHSFENFLTDLGRKPTPKHSLDRIDSNGNYEPSNCRWATHREQCLNRRSNRIITIGGVSKPLIEWVNESGLNYDTVWERLSRGCDPRVALFFSKENYKMYLSLI